MPSADYSVKNRDLYYIAAMFTDESAQKIDLKQNSFLNFLILPENIVHPGTYGLRVELYSKEGDVLKAKVK